MIVAISDMNIATRIDSYFTNVGILYLAIIKLYFKDNTTLGKKCEK